MPLTYIKNYIGLLNDKQWYEQYFQGEWGMLGSRRLDEPVLRFQGNWSTTG